MLTWLLKKQGIKNREGSTAVFLAIIISVLVLLMFTLINATKDLMYKAGADEVLQLSGRSVLSKFNPELKERYGIIAFCMTSGEVNKDIKYYTDYSFSSRRPLKINKIVSDTSGYSMAQLENFRKEVAEYGKYAILKGFLKKATNKENDSEDKGSNETGAEGKDRCLRNEIIINGLPSQNISGSIDIKKIGIDISSFKKFISSGSKEFLVNEYIINLFNNRLFRKTDEETFFSKEVEYIICGNLGDRQNKRSVSRKIVLLRNIVNLFHIYTDPSKKAKITAAAEIISPGPGALVVQAIIAEAWALAESKNDLELLLHNKKVPFVKNKQTWAVDFESIVTGKNIHKIDHKRPRTYIDTNCKTGMDYEDYLRLFLVFLREENKLLRMMDLMQINVQGSFDRCFSMKMSSTGFDFSAEVKGKNYVYREKY